MASGLPRKTTDSLGRAEGVQIQAALLDSESRSYHSPGTRYVLRHRQFQPLLAEVMGCTCRCSFSTPMIPLRDALTREAVWQSIRLSAPMGALVWGRWQDEKFHRQRPDCLYCTGGSTNHTCTGLHTPGRPASKSTGMISTTRQPWCLCSPACIPMARKM